MRERDQVDRRCRERHIAHCSAERQVVRPRRVLAPRRLQRGTEYLFGERANLLAPRGEILDGDADHRAGIGQHTIACPLQRACHLHARRRGSETSRPRPAQSPTDWKCHDARAGSPERVDEPRCWALSR
jgi:hypothetical protein